MSMLPREKREQLDAIVQIMVEKKESDETIRLVVDDFKAKYINAPPEQSEDLLSRASRAVGRVFPGEKLGEAVGTSIAGIGQFLKGEPERAKEILDTQVKPSEIAGELVNMGASLTALKGVGLVGSLGKRILTNIGLGGAISGGEAVSEDASAGEALRSALKGGSVGAAIPILGSQLRFVGRQIEQLPARFVNSALSRSKKEVLQDIAKDKVDDFANYVIKSKPTKTAKTLLSDSVDNVKRIGTQVAANLASAVRQSKEKVTIGRDNVLDEIVNSPTAQGALLKRADVRGIIERLAPQSKQLLQKSSLDLTEANKLRDLLDDTLGDRAFLGGQLSSDKKVLFDFTNLLRETVKNKAPEGTRPLFQELANEIRFRNGLLNRVAKGAGNQVLSFGDFIGGGLGGIFGSLGAQPLTGAFLGVATRRAIESVPFKIGSAKIISALTKASPVLEELTPAQQAVMLNLFAEIFSPDKNKQ